MERFDYLTCLREGILEEIGLVENADRPLFWDTTRPNYLTRNRLRVLFEKALDGAQNFGLYISARHCHCGSIRHVPEYIMESIAGVAISYRDSRYVWSQPLHQGEEDSFCPCKGKKIESAHWVIYDVIYEKTADQEFCSTLERVLNQVYEAFHQAGDKKPRSGIRECLLLALLIINDEILPQSVDAYIAAQKAERRS